MKLRTIALSLYGHQKDVSVPFSFETRPLCNYVQRFSRSLKIETNGFNQIVVQDDPFEPDQLEPRIVAEKSLKVPFKFDRLRYESASSLEKQRYFAEVLRHGLQRANDFQVLPLPSLLEKVEEFERSGFRNRWIHKSRSIRSHRLVAELQCELTMDAFNLTLEVRRQNGPAIRLDILTTKPDEICFHYKFKDIVIRDDHLVVTNRMHLSDELVRFPLSRFSALSDRGHG